MIHKKNRSRRLSTLILIGFLCITMNMSTLSVFAYAESAGGGAQTGETTARSEILTRAESDYPKIEILGVQEEVSQVPEKPFEFYKGVSMIPAKDEWHNGDEFRVAVTGVDTPSGGSYTFKPGDTGFTPSHSDNGKQYVVHYEVQKKSGNEWVSLDKPVTAETTVKVYALSEIKPLLNSDDAEVTKLYVASVTDGTGPFDADNKPGNDSSPTNKIVRSFDSVQYEIGYANKVKTQGVAYKDGYINFEFKLPCTKEIAEFDTGSMGWMATDKDHQWKVTTNPDGTQTLRASRRLMSKDGVEPSIPNAGQIPLVINIKQATNGQKIKPIFKAWMDYNKVVKEATAPQVTVTAAPKYNIQLKIGHDGYVGAIGIFDFARGNSAAFDKNAGKVYGQLQGVGLTFQLYNDRADKGLKGIEFPKGPVSFDVDVSAYFHDSKNNKDLYAKRPLLWAFDETKPDGELQGGRPVKG